MVHLVTGFAGEAHVASEDDGSKQAAIVGSGRYVANIGSEFEASIKSNNLIRIADGDLFNQGRHIRIPPNSYEEVTISNGSQGVNRNDLIVMRYEKSTSNGIETAALKVIKGTAGSTAKDPEYTQGDILAGEYVDEFPLYRVRITGLSIAAVEPMFDILLPMAEMYSRLNGNLTNKIQYREIQVEIGTSLPEGGYSSGAVDVSNEYPSAKKVVAIGGRRSGTTYVCNATVENNTTMYCTASSAGVYHVTIIGFY